MIQETGAGKHANDLYSQLMAISQEALENEYYETAYHTLAATMHLAKVTRNEHQLKAVAEAAQKQLNWIDTHAPEHRMSSQSREKHTGTNLYKTLLVQINADLLILRRQHPKHFLQFGDANDSNPSKN